MFLILEAKEIKEGSTSGGVAGRVWESSKRDGEMQDVGEKENGRVRHVGEKGGWVGG